MILHSVISGECGSKKCREKELLYRKISLSMDSLSLACCKLQGISLL